MQQSPSPFRAGGSDQHLPPEWLRGLISFVIFIHLFALGVAVLSNWYPSTLAMRLRNQVPLIKPYLQFLAMDQSYVPLYGLTSATQEDTDMAVEVELNLADGSKETFALPSNDLWPRQRWRRDERLAETFGDLTGESFRAVESILPQALAAHFVSTYSAKGGTIRCRRHFLQPIESMSSSDPTQRDPYDESRYTRLYEARILVIGNKVQLLKTETAADVAPAAVEKSQP
ncbi:MAG TPA: hypothetical protein VHC22_04095 [Pirellulales bacterium]|nr:hypothetical protein [Pirellulales bacterium]